jgi:hypothetical protein
VVSDKIIDMLSSRYNKIISDFKGDLKEKMEYQMLLALLLLIQLEQM